MVSHSDWRCWWGMQEAEQGNIRWQGDSSHSPCLSRASGNKPALWSATGCDIYSLFHRSWVGNDPNATWEFLGLISSWSGCIYFPYLADVKLFITWMLWSQPCIMPDGTFDIVWHGSQTNHKFKITGSVERCIYFSKVCQSKPTM